MDAAGVLPVGWLELSQRVLNPFGDDHQDARVHFCGWSCVERFAVLSLPERV